MDYRTITDLLKLIDEPNRSACYKLFKDHKERFFKSPGSSNNHQAWDGGYIGHLEEIMNVAVALHKLMNDFRKLDFTLSDALIVLFLHDLEKPFHYIEPKIKFGSDREKYSFIREMAEKYGITLTEHHLNALKYVHGEGNDYSKTGRVQKPLAAFVHICDAASARIWFDHPKKQ